MGNVNHQQSSPSYFYSGCVAKGYLEDFKTISKLIFQMNIQLILHEYSLLGQAKGGRMMFSGKGKEGAGWGYPQEYLVVIGD